MKYLLLLCFIVAAGCSQKNSKDSVQTTFDSAIKAGYDALDLAKEIGRERDSLYREAKMWKYLALKCNPNIRISRSILPDSTN